MTFITNILLVANYTFVISAMGDGPVRLLNVDGSKMQVVLVDNTGIVATLFEIENSAVAGGQENVAIVNVKDYRG